ncbi:MAG: single-stranded DNA-binding protein [Chlamydiia bacterium]|nr:single-stranded DNA-binding protein [Chlamydiia bacterium]
MNHLMLAGHLGTDPEVRYTSDGKKITTLRLAVNTRRSGKDDTMWWRLTIWDEQFDRMMPYLKKGSALIAFGEIKRPEIYNDREGKPQVSLEMSVSQLSFPPFGRGQSAEGGASKQQSHSQPQADEYASASAPTYGSAPAQQPQSFPDDEIPF